MKLTKTHKGYLEVHLKIAKEDKTYKVHRLVAMAFIPNPNNFPQINHKNENKEDNQVLNLEWCTNKYNARYSKSKKILQYDLNNNFIKEWECLAEVERQTNISYSNIIACCRGKRKTAGKYIWKYKDTQ